MEWAITQGHILTGGGLLEKLSRIQIDYDLSDLPHYYLCIDRNGSTIYSFLQFHRWKQNDEISKEIVGAWNRTLFSGGWRESTENDTFVCNLQTPSLFIDMRLSLKGYLLTPNREKKTSFAKFTISELKIIARQHCFAGYTYPNNIEKIPQKYTRYHIFDWNFNPWRPRNRPNQWFVVKNNENTSYKEYSCIRDELGIPIYFERWERFDNDSNGQKYLALVNSSQCAILIVVGNHFSFVKDRQYVLLHQYLSSCRFNKNFPTTGGPALVDYILDNEKDYLGNRISERFRRQVVEEYMGLEGCYGLIQSNQSPWCITHSTYPWKKNTPLLASQDVVNIHLEVQSIEWNGIQWKIFENSFSLHELIQLFCITHKLLSKL